MSSEESDFNFDEITDVDCPDCGSPMYRWTEGDHPVKGMTPRLKCTQCGRWIYHTHRDLSAVEK